MIVVFSDHIHFLFLSVSCRLGDLSLSISCRVSEYFCRKIVFACELTFGQLSIGELLCNAHLVIARKKNG